MNRREERAAQRQSEMAMFDDVWSGNETRTVMIVSGEYNPHNGYQMQKEKRVRSRVAGAENVFVEFSEHHETGYAATFDCEYFETH